MSDSEDSPKKAPGPQESTDTEAPEVEQADQSEADTDGPHRARSRSQSRRARRQKQKQGDQKKGQRMEPVQEAQAEADDNGAEAMASQGAMQPFQHIGPDSTSMDGPVTYAKAQRGEIPMRPGNPQQSLQTGNPKEYNPDDYGEKAMQPKNPGGKQESQLMQQEGLKLRLELNLDIEIELKAKIYGDLTIGLLN